MFACEKKEKTSRYKGVDWNKKRKIWRVRVWSKEGKSKFGGHFQDELDAVKRVNQLCEELGIPPQNPDIVDLPAQQSLVAENYFVLSDDIVRKVSKLRSKLTV